MRSPIPISEFDASDAGIAEAVTLPPAAFHSPAFYAFELEAVWRREWVCIGRAADVPEPGDRFTVTLGDEPLLVVREPSGELAVRDGSRQDVRSELWEGFVFVTFDDEQPPLAERLGDLAEQLAPWEMSTLRAPEPMALDPGEWNWKVFSDECYHCGFLHSTSWCRMFPTPTSRVDHRSALNDEARGIIAYELIGREIGSAPTHTGKALHPFLPRLTDEQLSRLHYVTVMPNLLLICMPDKVKYFLWLPTGPASSIGAFSWLFPDSTLADPGFTARWQREKDDLAGVVAEDWYAWRTVQRGLASRFAPRGRFAPAESVVLAFNRWLIERYRAADAAAAPAGVA